VDCGAPSGAVELDPDASTEEQGRILGIKPRMSASRLKTWTAPRV